MSDLNATDVITVENLHKTYGDKSVLNGISLSVRRGEIFGVLGPNGAGKTTALETIVGLRHPSKGQVRVLNHDPAADRAYVTARMAVQPQAAALFPTLTVKETLQLFASFYEAPLTPEELMHELDLSSARDVRIKHLSGGQERRLLIGVALIGKPEILVLDEPSAGLDPQARRNLWDILRTQQAQGTTILLSTHHMDEAAQVCDRIAVFVAGRVAVEGEPGSLISEYSSKSTVTFEVPVLITAEEIVALGIPGDVIATATGATTQVSILTLDPDTVLRRVTFTPGIQARGFRVQRGSLEDLFIDLASN